MMVGDEVPLGCEEGVGGTSEVVGWKEASIVNGHERGCPQLRLAWWVQEAECTTAHQREAAEQYIMSHKHQPSRSQTTESEEKINQARRTNKGGVAHHIQTPRNDHIAGGALHQVRRRGRNETVGPVPSSS
jgi:hypothetical protein